MKLIGAVYFFRFEDLAENNCWQVYFYKYMLVSIQSECINSLAFLVEGPHELCVPIQD